MSLCAVLISSQLIQSDRRGDAQRVAQNVRGRHQDIQKIEQQMMELAQLFQDLETLVVQQEPAVAQIEQKAEDITGNVGKGNTELDGAVKKARAARRKKWICLGIIGNFKPAASLIMNANLDSRHHYCRPHRCPRYLGREWYAVRSQVEGECKETGYLEATILEILAELRRRLFHDNDADNGLKRSDDSQSHCGIGAFSLDSRILLHQHSKVVYRDLFNSV